MSAARPGRPGTFWRRRSLRWQVMASVVVINLCAALVAFVVTIANARRATGVEIGASLAMAERYVAETIERLAQTGDGSVSLTQLPLHVGGLRHVRIRIEDAQGRLVGLAPAAGGEGGAEAGEHEEVPDWFADLVTVDRAERDIPVMDGGRAIGRVRVAGEAADEIAEVWEDTTDLALLAVIVNIAILAALYVALGRLLRPLRTLSEGLSALEAGRFGHRLPLPPARELAAIADRFNALGAALNAARQDNARLAERLVRVQDDERRQIASDLHDELGPCLFGLRANLESVERLVAGGDAVRAGQIAERMASLAEILDRIQGLNRQLLRRIRPMALDHVPLADVIADLMADFRSHAPERTFHLRCEGLAERYGDSVDLTVYRCVQEAVTNALRHGEASAIRVGLSADAAAGRLDLVVEDDGVGMAPAAAPGFGMIGIEERLAALGGSWRILPARPRGTRLEMSIPARSAAAGRGGDSERRAAE
ncbi:ATP-binding protein [Ancylobacter terrae]|uniref:ATP-binding protein n=1 Tax=Ancylobacter sp. sgz301288 TaxID=3342077 RepID=UPI0038591633